MPPNHSIDEWVKAQTCLLSIVTLTIFRCPSSGRHVLQTQVYVCVCMPDLRAESCLSRWDPLGCSLPGSSVQGVFQARILEWVAISFSRESSQPRDRACVYHVSCVAGRLFTHRAIGEPHACVLMSVCHHLTSASVFMIWRLAGN